MRKWLGFLLVGLLLCPSGGIAQSRRGKKPTKPKSVTQLRSDLNSLRKRKSELQRELRTTKRAAKAVVADINRVDAELTQVEAKLEETGERLAESRNQQRRVSDELQVATRRLVETREQVRRRIKRMYMQGDSNLLTVMVGTGDVGEISSRQFVMQRIAEQDRRVFTAYREARERVATKKAEADALVKRVGTLLAEQRNQQVALADVKDRKRTYLKELQQKQSELQRMLAQFEADEASIASQIRAFQRRRVRAGGKVQPYRGGVFAYPVAGPITSNFGMRFHPILRISRLHAGCDFGAPHGAPIRAAAAGEVIRTAYMRGYGNVVMIDHGGGISTVYAHCSRISASDGQKVRRGQVIANVGATGLATGPHLHFEVRVNGAPVNPRRYL